MRPMARLFPSSSLNEASEESEENLGSESPVRGIDHIWSVPAGRASRDQFSTAPSWLLFPAKTIPTSAWRHLGIQLQRHQASKSNKLTHSLSIGHAYTERKFPMEARNLPLHYLALHSRRPESTDLLIDFMPFALFCMEDIGTFTFTAAPKTFWSGRDTAVLMDHRLFVSVLFPAEVFRKPLSAQPYYDKNRRQSCRRRQEIIFICYEWRRQRGGRGAKSIAVRCRQALVGGEEVVGTGIDPTERASSYSCLLQVLLPVEIDIALQAAEVALYSVWWTV
ncbi:unnamed protein product [Somion occarium]|uniref:Uncharacterized protein n=1 Tax=Somion occarium TaxID=3059160 RepID=A0ABP1D598_9APHY